MNQVNIVYRVHFKASEDGPIAPYNIQHNISIDVDFSGEVEPEIVALRAVQNLKNIGIDLIRLSEPIVEQVNRAEHHG